MGACAWLRHATTSRLGRSTTTVALLGVVIELVQASTGEILNVSRNMNMRNELFHTHTYLFIHVAGDAQGRRRHDDLQHRDQLPAPTTAGRTSTRQLSTAMPSSATRCWSPCVFVAGGRRLGIHRGRRLGVHRGRRFGVHRGRQLSSGRRGLAVGSKPIALEQQNSTPQRRRCID